MLFLKTSADYYSISLIIHALMCTQDILGGHIPRWLTVGISGFTGNLYFLYSFLGSDFLECTRIRFIMRKTPSSVCGQPRGGLWLGSRSAERRRQGAALAAGSRRPTGRSRRLPAGGPRPRTATPRRGSVDLRLSRPSQDESGGSCKKDDSPAAASRGDAPGGAQRAEMGSSAGRHRTGRLNPGSGAGVGVACPRGHHRCHTGQ